MDEKQLCEGDVVYIRSLTTRRAAVGTVEGTIGAIATVQLGSDFYNWDTEATLRIAGQTLRVPFNRLELVRQ